MTQANLNERLEELAYRKSEPFCYSCYKAAPAGRCAYCGSDDLMRLVPGVGCEWGVDWVIRHIVAEELDAVDTGATFEDSVREIYPGTTAVGWIELDTVNVIKEMDPTSWDLARSEWIDAEESDGNLVTFDNGSTYYWRHDIESLLDEAESD